MALFYSPKTWIKTSIRPLNLSILVRKLIYYYASSYASERCTENELNERAQEDKVKRTRSEGRVK